MSQELNIEKENSKNEETSQAAFPEDSHAPGPAITNQQQATQNMETHAHHLHKAPGSGWKHYFFEFFMLFLAVTAGYFVENQREHYLDHQREKIFMASMIEDVTKDSLMLSKVEHNARAAALNIDTLVDILQNLKLDDSSLIILYRANLKALSYFGPVFTDRTSAQLKNSGAMRLIRKRDVADSIINYWSQEDLIVKANERIEEYKIRARDQSYSIFDQKYYSIEETGVHLNTTNPRLMTENTAQLTELANRLFQLRAFIRLLYIPAILTQKQTGWNLIQVIKKEYNLD